VFVGNIDFATTRQQLETLFSEVARPVDVFLPIDRATGRPRGFAFVEFENAEQARQVIERFNEHDLDGRALRVNLAEDRPRRAPSFGGGDAPAFGRSGKPKGSRRNLRARKRSL
jgi:RNA recognition motif-containing protein